MTKSHKNWNEIWGNAKRGKKRAAEKKIHKISFYKKKEITHKNVFVSQSKCFPGLTSQWTLVLNRRLCKITLKYLSLYTYCHTQVYRKCSLLLFRMHCSSDQEKPAHSALS